MAKGKYVLDIIDNELYSTDSYELYNLYNRLFYPEPVKEHIPIERSYDCHTKATKETWKKALQQEKEYYENGYIYKLEEVTIFGKKWKKGRWVKNPEKAKLIFEEIKKKHPKLLERGIV